MLIADTRVYQELGSNSHYNLASDASFQLNIHQYSRLFLLLINFINIDYSYTSCVCFLIGECGAKWLGRTKWPLALLEN